MITILDYAKLSLFVYKGKVVNAKYLNGYVNKQAIMSTAFDPVIHNNGIYEVIVSELYQSTQAQENGFYASFFIKVFEQQVKGAVIAIRGTVPKIYENDIVDINSWWRKVFNNNGEVNLPENYLQQASHFYSKVRRYTKEVLNLPATKLYITGHSLGGALAALLPTYFRYPSCAVTFNAPGIKDAPGVHNYWQKVINFRTKYDFISAMGQPIGPVWNIPVPEREKEAAEAFKIAKEHEYNKLSYLDRIKTTMESIDFIASVLQQHSMVNLLKALEYSRKNSNIATNSYNTLESILAKVDHKANTLNSPYIEAA